jgi:hypothetical protein
LQGVMAVVTFLAKRGLALRGDDWILGSPTKENFLDILEVISFFDSFPKEHFEIYGIKGKGKPSYMLFTIRVEMIDF